MAGDPRDQTSAEMGAEHAPTFAELKAVSDACWERLSGVNEKESDALLAFAKAAMDAEAARATVIEQKGNWTIATALGLISLDLAAIGWLVEHRPGAQELLVAAVLLAALVGAAAVCFYAVAVEQSWSQPAFLALLDRPLWAERAATVECGVALKRRITMHYLDIYHANMAATARRAGFIKTGQWLMMATVVVAVLTVLHIAIGAYRATF